MRLDAQQKLALEKSLKGVEGEVFLFGSRTDLNKKGGDVDLLIFSSASPFKLSLQVSTRYFEVCEEKIDVVVMNPETLTTEQQVFLANISKERIQ